jgi:tetratricopeptide (TPR) repeat protein
VELVGALLTLGDFHYQLARYARAESIQRRALHRLDTVPSDARHGAIRLNVLIHLANSQRRQGNFDTAEVTLRLVVGRTAPVELLSAANNALGVVYKDTGRYAEAADHYAAALATSTQADLTASIYHNIAGLAHAERRFADAVPPARAALALHRRECGPTATEVAADAAVLGAVLLDLGHLDEAEVHLRHAYRIWVSHFGPDHYETAVCLHGLGVARYHRGDPEAALPMLETALRIKTTALGPDHPEIAALLHNLAVVRMATGGAAGLHHASRPTIG